MGLPLYIDFEFGHSKKRYLGLVCCVWQFQNSTRKFNLLSKKERERCRDELWFIADQNPDVVLVSYGIDAEVRSLFSLFQVNHINKLPFKHFICLHREHKMLANKSKALCYGEVIASSQKVKRPFNADKAREDNKDDKKYVNLLNALYKFLNVFSVEHCSYKTLYTEMCVRQHIPELENNMEGILEYCEMDVKHLPALYKTVWVEECTRLKEFPPEQLYKWALLRGRYGAIVAEKVQNGYYIDKVKYMNMTASYGAILTAICEEINKQWPINTFVYDPKLLRYVFKSDVVRHYIRTNAPSYIMKSFKLSKKTKQLSISTETFEQLWGNNKHSLDRNEYLQQIYRYLYTNNSLRGLVRR